MTDVMRQASQEGSGTGRHLHAVPSKEEHSTPPAEIAGGVLLPVYDTEVDTTYRKSLGTTIHDGVGVTWHEEWQMTDGIRKNIAICEPKKAKTDVVVVKDTALGTQTEGFNEDVGRLIMKLDMPMVIIGPEKGGSTPLSQSAHNTHKILDVAERLGYFRPNYAAVEGYSRGAMLGFGIIGYGPQHKRKIIFANLTDPCLAMPISIDREQIEDLLEHGPKEALTAFAQMGRLMLSPRKAWHYRKTADISWNGLKQLVDTGAPLFSGESGFMASQMPEDTHATVAFFRNSLANHQAAYEKILDPYPNVKIKKSKWGHLAGMDERILSNISNNFSALSRQLSDGVHPDNLDYEAIQSRQVA